MAEIVSEMRNPWEGVQGSGRGAGGSRREGRSGPVWKGADGVGVRGIGKEWCVAGTNGGEAGEV